jgi:hypothetical protein
MKRLFRLFVPGILFLALSAPALAETLCSAGNLSGLMGTTCDIGDLQFTFTSFMSMDTATGTPWSPSNFTFTPVSTSLTNGFTLTFDGGPQSITAPAGADVADDAELSYLVGTLNTEDITSESVTGGATSASGSTFSVAEYTGETHTGGLVVSEDVGTVQEGGKVTHFDFPFNRGIPFRGGFGDAFPFELFARDGASAAWDGLPTTYTYTTAPEPDSLLLLSIALVSLGGFALRSR